MEAKEAEDLEIELLLEALRQRCGFDFQHYSQASLRRRLRHSLLPFNFEHISEAIPRIIHDRTFLDKLIYTLSVTVTELFRDPPFYRKVREKVIPILKTFPFINIWHAGCATGEEVYSMAIILKEEGLLDRARIYATDINGKSLEQAREGIYSIENLRDYTKNYQKAGGKLSLSDYYHSKYDLVRMDPELKENVVFANYNLVTDNVFTEVHLVFCRNVLIYFDRTLQDRVLNLFHDSLVRGGVLCLGTKESIGFSDVSGKFTTLSDHLKIYQKRSQLYYTPSHG
ncbi:MAG: protein-glutamate O-methyltransferase CheR [Magnetococcales bacterium]|nr:protein-glutamate O-methyltransferase CheR [Magnetococcales bacterium]